MYSVVHLGRLLTFNRPISIYENSVLNKRPQNEALGNTTPQTLYLFPRVSYWGLLSRLNFNISKLVYYSSFTKNGKRLKQTVNRERKNNLEYLSEQLEVALYLSSIKTVACLAGVDMCPHLRCTSATLKTTFETGNKHAPALAWCAFWLVYKL